MIRKIHKLYHLVEFMIILEEAHTGEPSFSRFLLEREPLVLTAEEFTTWRRAQTDFLFRMKRDAKLRKPAAQREGEALETSGIPDWKAVMSPSDARQFHLCLTDEGHWRPEPAARIYGYFVAARVLHAILKPS